MSNILEDLKNKFKKEDTSNTSRRDMYPFWNIPVDASATVRLLPDLNKDNPMRFLIEKKTHKLEIDGQVKTVPCLKMYGEKECPICKISSSYYAQGDEVTGKKYYRKVQHLAQALIVKDPIPLKDGEESAEGTVKILTFDWKIYNIIKNAFTSGDLDEVPYAYEGGTDFIITKSMQGKWSDYSLSKFARKSYDLTDEQIEYCEENLVDLSTMLPANPGYDKIEAMLHAALTGGKLEDHDEDDDDDVPDFSAVKKPKPKPPVNEDDDEEEAPRKKAPRPPVDEDDEEEAPRTTKKKAPVVEEDEVDEEVDDILAAINRRRAAKLAGQ